MKQMAAYRFPRLSQTLKGKQPIKTQDGGEAGSHTLSQWSAAACRFPCLSRGVLKSRLPFKTWER